MAKFNAGAHRDFGCEARQSVQMYDHHVAQVDPRDDGRGRLRIPEQHIAVAHIRAAVERNRQLGALCGRLSEATLLRLPLVDLQQVHGSGGQPLGPFRIADIAQNSFDNRPWLLLS